MFFFTLHSLLWVFTCWAETLKMVWPFARFKSNMGIHSCTGMGLRFEIRNTCLQWCKKYKRYWIIQKDLHIIFEAIFAFDFGFSTLWKSFAHVRGLAGLRAKLPDAHEYCPSCDNGNRAKLPLYWSYQTYPCIKVSWWCGSIWYFYVFPALTKIVNMWKFAAIFQKLQYKGQVSNYESCFNMFQCHFLPNLRRTTLPPRRCWAKQVRSNSKDSKARWIFLKSILTI